MCCTDFELLGIMLDQTLSRMDNNYDGCLKSLKDKLNSWHFRHIMVFGKVTIIKTMCLPKFTHIETDFIQLNEIEREWENLI